MRLRYYTVLAIALIMLFMLGGCVSGTVLKVTEATDIKGIEGEFTLFYYLPQDRADLRRAVILDLNEDDYEFIPSVRDFEYEILQDVNIKEAVYETNVFFQQVSYIHGALFSYILDPKGKPIGIEIRPMYDDHKFGKEDILNMQYTMINKNKIKVMLEYLPGIILEKK